MCTSFAVFAERPIYGMNFDFPEVEIRLQVAAGSEGEVFYLCFEWDGGVHRTAGLNSRGLFSAAQILVAHFEMIPQAAEVQVSPYEVFIHSLQSGERVEDVLAILGPRRLGYRTDRKGHQLYADCTGAVCILEPGPEGNRIYRSDRPFTVMANRPIQKELERTATHAGRLGLDRYQTASRLIEGKRRFGVEDGFEVLHQTMLVRGRFITQSSIVCDPQAGEVYLALKRGFDRVWKVSLTERTVETFAGFGKYHKAPLTEAGISGSELQELAC